MAAAFSSKPWSLAVPNFRGHGRIIGRCSGTNPRCCGPAPYDATLRSSVPRTKDYSPECLEKLFGNSEWAPLWAPTNSRKLPKKLRKISHLADAPSLMSDLGYPYYLTRTGYRHLPPFGSHPGPSLSAPVQRPRASLAQIGSCGFYPGFLIIPSGCALPCDCSRAHRTEAVRPQGEKFACV